MTDEQEKAKSDTALREEEVLKFWKDNKIFEKSLEKESPKGNFVFYDGPPFATGLPHYGHILAGTIKDVIPRYKTMQGHYVRRVWGWDCHGLPIENMIEKELGLGTKKDIENFGIEKFNKAARESVLRYEEEWKKVIPRVGRWVDMDHAYKTMDTSYTESVWTSFKKLFDNNLVYEGFKSMHLCPRCGTTLSNFEVNQGYKDITDISVYVKFQLSDESNTYLLAWTTTPWTLPGNVALAVNPKERYIKIKIKEEILVLAKARLAVLKEEYEVIGEIDGKDLVGLKYKPVFNYYENAVLDNKENAWKVYGAEFVTMEDGTGIVHIAPMFGEDDLNLAKEQRLPLIQHVNQSGEFNPEVTDFAGQLVKPKDDPANPSGQAHQKADVEIIKYLAHKNLLFAKEKIVHSYPHCWRCDTPLLNYATSSWFVKVVDLKDRMVALNNKVKWVPEEIGKNRFGRWLEGARDWAVSRSRYWGAPLPVWRSKNGDTHVFGSIEELKTKIKSSHNKYFAVRHGEGEHTVLDIVSNDPNLEHHLTEKGKGQAKEAGEKLKKEKIDAIYCSPYVRTKETAEIIAEATGFPKEKIIFDDRIQELGFGDFHLKPFGDFLAYEESSMKNFNDKLPNGESYQDAKNRVGDFLYEIDGKHQNQNILIVTHGIFLEVFPAVIMGADAKVSKNLVNTVETELGKVYEYSFVPIPHNENYELDLHRPYIDGVELLDENGERLERVKEVFDTWYDSGSMPYAQIHYPFENREEFENKNSSLFPADFIAEGLDQTRGWFYTLLVLGTGLFDKSPFEHVIVNGIVLAEDGQKMSKRLKNYPDPMYVVDRYGADTLRYYLLSSSVVRAEDLAFSERGLDEVHKKLILRLGNVLDFYKMYKTEDAHDDNTSKNILDKWIISRTNELGAKITDSLEKYELDRASRPILDFVDDLSTWYIRRSRDRFKSDDVDDKNNALATTKFVLLELAKYMAPFTPFFAESIYSELKTEKDPESVHLCEWPQKGEVDEKLLEDMGLIRSVVSDVLMIRNKENIKVRQPLGKLTIQDDRLKDRKDLVELIKDEINVKEVVFDKHLAGSFSLDVVITQDLKREGDMRELVRAVQDLRKQKALHPSDLVNLSIETDEAGKMFVESVINEIKKPTNVVEIKFEVNEGGVLKIGEMTFKLSLLKADD